MARIGKPYLKHMSNLERTTTIPSRVEDDISNSLRNSAMSLYQGQSIGRLLAGWALSSDASCFSLREK